MGLSNILYYDRFSNSEGLNSAFNQTHNIKTRAMSELLIRRRLDVLRELQAQENLSVKVEFVPSEKNLADKLT